jgi:hypothetical protein
LGGLLAVLAALLPRILPRWEARPETERLSLQEMGPTPARPVLTMAPTPETDASEDPMIAAAIALALALYQRDLEGTGAAALAGFGPGVTSPWAMAGRVWAMQGPRAVKKR